MKYPSEYICVFWQNELLERRNWLFVIIAYLICWRMHFRLTWWSVVHLAPVLKYLLIETDPMTFLSTSSRIRSTTGCKITWCTIILSLIILSLLCIIHSWMLLIFSQLFFPAGHKHLFYWHPSFHYIVFLKFLLRQLGFLFLVFDLTKLSLKVTKRVKR